MLDNKILRKDIQIVAKKLAIKGFVLDVEKYNALENKRKLLQEEVEALQNIRNETSKKIGIAKSNGEDVSKILSEISKLSEKSKIKSQKLDQLLKEKLEFLSVIPNLPDDDVPNGKSEEDNVVLRTVGDITHFPFNAKDHVDLGEGLRMMDFESATKVSGARFVILKGKLAKLQRALIQFMLDTHAKEHGYQETYVPYIVSESSLFGTGQLPKFKEDQFSIADDQNRALIPTAEVPLTNIFRDEIVTIDRLPIKMMAHTPCFRSEVGSYGKDKRGMFRQHQFEKVELVMLAHPDTSDQLHEALTKHAETILEKLELPYRTVILCGGDLGFSAAKTYDIEVWLPGQNQYREISSCSNFRDFQARRMQARFRNPETGKTEFLHTLNGSGLAVGRTLIAVMENYQDADGNIRIPSVLQPYMQNETIIKC